MWQHIINVISPILGAIDSWKRAFIVAFFVTFLTVGYLVFPIAQRYVDSMDAYISMENRIKMDGPITSAILTLQTKIDADRVMIFELHNGKVNASGVHFAYISSSYEVVKPGFAKILLDTQNLPTSLLAGDWGPLLEGKCVFVDPTFNTYATPSITDWMSSNGVGSLGICPISSPDDERLVGLVMTQWADDIEDKKHPEYILDMQLLSYKLSGMLSSK